VVLAEVNELARKGKDLISFCIGQPDFHTPVNVQDAAMRAVREGKHGYTPSAGIAELREAAARYMGAMRGLTIRPEDVVIGGGAKPFIAYTILSTTDYGVGDEVIYPNPGFPIYESQIVANGAVPVPLHLREARNFAFDPAELESKITKKTKLLILNSPQNPTGGILGKKDLEAIAAILARHPDVWIYADEIYSRLCYEGEFCSIASLPGMYERTIISDGASKTWAMTGWRIGFASNPVLAPQFVRWVPTPVPCLAHQSMGRGRGGQRGHRRARRCAGLPRRRDQSWACQQGAGRVLPPPGGAFYAWPNVTEACRMIGATDSGIPERLLNEAGRGGARRYPFRRVPGGPASLHTRLPTPRSSRASRAWRISSGRTSAAWHRSVHGGRKNRGGHVGRRRLVGRGAAVEARRSRRCRPVHEELGGRRR
jgi:aspartate/methionine/tyrosine aminotransferase